MGLLDTDDKVMWLCRKLLHWYNMSYERRRIFLTSSGVVASQFGPACGAGLCDSYISGRIRGILFPKTQVLGYLFRSPTATFHCRECAMLFLSILSIYSHCLLMCCKFMAHPSAAVVLVPFPAPCTGLSGSMKRTTG